MLIDAACATQCPIALLYGYTGLGIAKRPAGETGQHDQDAQDAMPATAPGPGRD